MINLAINYYQTTSTIRQQELDRSIITNYNSQLFENIINFSDYQQHLVLRSILKNNVTNLIHKYHPYRPKFNQIIEHLNLQYPQQICIIANLDIIFDQTIQLANFVGHKQILCLTRWETPSITWQQNVMTHFAGQWCIDNYYNINYLASKSQDVWIFRTPVHIPYQLLDFPMGILGCDEKLGSLAHEHNYAAINSCLSIKCYHNHISQIRTYDTTYRLDHKFYPSEPCHFIYYS